MQEDNILRKIIESTYTLRDLQRRTRILKKYLLNKFYSSNEPLDPEINGEMSWLSSLGDDFFKQFNGQNQNEIFSKIDEKISSYSPLTIYLAFEPSSDDILAIGNWLRKNTTNQFIFDLKFDHDLIGGCAIVKNGQYKDYSLRAKLEENSSQISEIIRSNLISKIKAD